MPQNQVKKRNDKESSVVNQCEESNSSCATSVNGQLNNSGSSSTLGKSRKRKRCEVVRFSDLESEFEDCDLEDAAALETKLRKVARRNSLTHEEMMKLLHKFVKNEHILALVTLKAEDELAKEKRKEEEQRAIIITETPSIPKLTRAKARELNKTPTVKLTPLKDQEQHEIASLIKEDLHSDEDDEEYVFQEEDFVSDDDPNNTASDLESNPRTPMTPASQIEDSPVKLSEDGCFKVPLNKKAEELTQELRIATRTRSKYCLQQTTIEDLQSEFVPPDVEEPLEVSDLQPLDEDWMQFLTDFTKPLNSSLVGDDDDPINDPEYVAAEKEPENKCCCQIHGKMDAKEDFQMKYEYEDSNFSTYYSDYREDEQSDPNQLNDSLGELVAVKTLEGNTINVYLRLGNRILFCSGKYFYLEYTTARTDHQKEYTGIVSTCHTCGVKIKGSLKVSSNFICHLKGRHPEVYKEFLKQKQELAGSSTRLKKLEKYYGSLRTNPYPANISQVGNTALPYPDKQDQFQRNLLQFLISSNQDFRLVEDRTFQKLFEFMDFPVQIKTADYYDQIIKDDCKYKELELCNLFNQAPVFVCHTSDVWCYGDCKYLACACFWIDDNFQRQAALLACKRLNATTNDSSIADVQQDILRQYCCHKDYIVSCLTGNIQNYKENFIDFGLRKEVLSLHPSHSSEDCSFLQQIHDNLNFPVEANVTGLQLQQLDLQKLNKLWSTEFMKYLDKDTKLLHQKCLEKCCSIWLKSHSQEFKKYFIDILNTPIIRPNLFSLTSLYTSLKQLLNNKDHIAVIFDFIKKPCFSLPELEYLEDLVDVFEPLHAAFEFLDMQQNHFYGCFLPTLVTLKWKLTRLINNEKLKYLHDVLVKLKELLLQEFKAYYELNESKTEAILAAITYPPVKTRFLMGLQDTASCFNFQARSLLLKYAKDYHTNEENNTDDHLLLKQEESCVNNTSMALDFFDFGDTTENVDAEELRDVNISKKELSELVAELYDSLMVEGLAMESIDLETPRKCLVNYQEDRLHTPHHSPKALDSRILNVSQQLDYQKEVQHTDSSRQEPQSQLNAVTSTNTIHHHHNYTFQPDVMSTPTTHCQTTDSHQHVNDLSHTSADIPTLIPIAQTAANNVGNSLNDTVSIGRNNLNTQVDLIAVPISGQPNCFKLAKIVQSPELLSSIVKENNNNNIDKENIPSSSNSLAERYSVPYETNYTCKYVSVRRHVIKEYIDKFENLKYAQDNKISSTTSDTDNCNSQQGFTQYQYDLMQQQMRIHVQQLTQTFVQAYCHPEFWKLAPKTKDMLLELKEKSKDNNNFKIWNLDKAVELVENWQKELDQDTPENAELMKFLHHEISATNSNSRQIPRFHPRILECYLNSPVFMYPQYLPRMPFSPKAKIHVFSPAESYLIAMGLEKHLKLIYDKMERVPPKTTPLRTACKRLCKDTLHGKRYRRVWGYIMHLQKVDYYNPIKYFFEHNKAPPVEPEPIIGFENNTVLPPKDRIPELPLVYQTYLRKKNATPKKNSSKRTSKRSATDKNIKVSETFRNSYVDFVREALGQDLPIPHSFSESTEASDTQVSDCDALPNCLEKRKKSTPQKPAAKRRLPQSLTINVNYVFGNSLDVSNTSTPSLRPLTVPNYNIDTSLANTTTTHISANGTSDSLLQPAEATITNNSTCSLVDSSINTLADNTQNSLTYQNNLADYPVITYNFDLQTKTLQPVIDSTLCEQVLTTTDPSPTTGPILPNNCNTNNHQETKLKVYRKTATTKNVCYGLKLNKKIKQKASAYREKRNLQKRCEDLITTYSLYLETILLKYRHHPLIQHYYKYFKALELYTNLLTGLKYICHKYSTNMSSPSSSNSPSNLKRSRNTNSNNDDDCTPSSARQVRKLNRQEENFRHMLLPDTPEEANRKDAIYAFNFYEKVEEAFKASNRPEDCKKFNNILKYFDPKTDKVSDLYYKLEKLFLPDHPELAQVFLTFLLPSEAAEIGKFFEHFMINNMATFINKLNIYFNKQPAQIRKIYNCLNDLAEDPNVTMKKVETKIIPLLKGNQFLIDWFMQQFPQNTPPERLFSAPEHIINLKEQQSNRSGEYVETITLMDSPTNDNQQKQSCQLRYINGRIFYGSKMLLPAKLSFMAASYKDKHLEDNDSTTIISPSTGCVHGIKEHGDKRLQAAADLTSTHNTTIEPPASDDHEKSEEEDASKALVIDITADEEDSCSSVELCDEAALRAHALRLNPSVYSSTCYASANATSTPNINSNFQAHHPNAKKTSLNFNDEQTKLSPRKNSSSSTTTSQQNLCSPLSVLITSPMNSRDKRKSPIKKTKSPLNNRTTKTTANHSVQPMVVIHETNSAIQCAKRLKSLIDEGEPAGETTEEIIDSKEIIQIVARTKSSLKSSTITNNCGPTNCQEVKEENTDDLEFITENANLSPSPFPCLRMDTDSNEEDVANSKTPTPPPPPPPPSCLPPAVPTVSSAQPNPSALASDEDSKIDIVTTLTTSSSTGEETLNTGPPPPPPPNSTTVLPLNSAWTRDEDKIILIEMKLGSQNRQELYHRIAEKLPKRTMFEISARHQFLMDFLSKLQGK